jgi:hypothetical protein
MTITLPEWLGWMFMGLALLDCIENATIAYYKYRLWRATKAGE